MSFGVVQTMITTLKNNEKMRSKRSNFKRTVSISGYNKQKPEYDFPEATPQILNEIKERLQKERKRRTYKVVALTIILFLGLAYLVYVELK
jgi:hypothetical protein